MRVTRTELRRFSVDGPLASHAIAPLRGDADALLATVRVARECQTA